MVSQQMQLTPEESRAVQALSRRIARGFASSDDPDLTAELGTLATDLPARIRREVDRFRLADEHPFLILRGHVVDADAIGPTPADWRCKTGPDPAFAEEALVLLYAALLGEPFAWRTQQDGHLVHDVFPVSQDEHEQLGTGSRELLTWHSEDAFHPCRADYLLLFALRNPDRVATTIGFFEPSWLPQPVLDTLFEPRFLIRPDESHLVKNNTMAAHARAAFEQILHMQTHPEPVPVLEGDRASPYLRLDPYFMSTPPGDARARDALDSLTSAIDAHLLDVVLEAGDVVLLDNRRAVHGRRSFVARFDGTDRWLKRVNVTRDLRKSRALRGSATCRQIG